MHVQQHLHLLPMVELFEERAALAEYEGGLHRQDAEQLATRCLYIIARSGKVGKKWQQGVFHALPRAEWDDTGSILKGVDFVNYWHVQLLEHGWEIPTDTEYGWLEFFSRALCGATLRRERDACWVAGDTVTCQPCRSKMRL